MFPIRDHNPSTRTPFVTYALLGANVTIWVWSVIAAQNDVALSQLYYDFALIPARVTGGEGWGGFVTSMFLHGGILHLAGNMLFLFIFGDNMEDRMGHLPYALFYLACGIAAGFAQVASEPFSAVPTIGASGAIAGVMGGYLLLFPKARVDVFLFFIVFFRIIPIPAWITLALWFLVQLWGGFGSNEGVAYWAHNGGFIAGVLLTVPLWITLGGPRFWQKTHGHPDNPPAHYRTSTIPKVSRRR
ncbi:rhomboid family intramembrane serine protease [Loktanella sp. SALINAS62]|uniref:rhomboid family intramembrane serine protease n=1 Tax=Loktanella sp. SALINAS62 TaxID=2706124 RepID=UPI001B8AC9D9|nr:rhomboid family intramembrane serine protease [Loktanella sp. SALINAS62]MBS1300780.1 rhomboid family intramembrane serine protease [Loktanella sp. SALINAS62]